MYHVARYRGGRNGGETVKPDTLTTVKFKRLQRRLGVPRPYVIGLLETMWLVAHAAGDPVLGDAVDVEAAAEWPGEEGAFAAALVDCRFLDQLDDGRLACHDYWHHAPKYVRDRVCAAIRRALGFDRWRQVLAAFAVVVDDGGDDGTPAAVVEILSRSPAELRRLLELHPGPMSIADRERLAASPAEAGACVQSAAPAVVECSEVSSAVADCRLQTAPLPFPSPPKKTPTLRSGVSALPRGDLEGRRSRAPDPEPDPEPRRGEGEARREAVGQVSELWRAHGLKPPVPSRIAQWLKDWELYPLLAVLEQCAKRGYLKAGPTYVARVLETAKANGGKLLEAEGNAYVAELRAMHAAFEGQRGRATG